MNQKLEAKFSQKQASEFYKFICITLEKHISEELLNLSDSWLNEVTHY